MRSTSDSTLQTPVSRKPDATTKRSSAQRLPAATPKTPSTSKSTGNTARYVFDCLRFFPVKDFVELSHMAYLYHHHSYNTKTNMELLLFLGMSPGGKCSPSDEKL